MSKLDDVRALFVPGGQVRCEDNTYHRANGREELACGRVFTVKRVGKSVWVPTDAAFRGTFPTRVSDVVSVDEERATWKLGRGDHTVTYARVAS